MPFIKKHIVPILVFLVLASAGVASYYYLQFSRVSGDPAKISEREAQALIAKVSQLIVLPADETPTVATVTDPDKLKSQPFFANAKAGDKVLIYTAAGKAILYDPVSNKIVEVAPVDLNTAPSANGIVP